MKDDSGINAKQRYSLMVYEYEVIGNIYDNPESETIDPTQTWAYSSPIPNLRSYPLCLLG